MPAIDRSWTPLQSKHNSRTASNTNPPVSRKDRWGRTNSDICINRRHGGWGSTSKALPTAVAELTTYAAVVVRRFLQPLEAGTAIVVE